MKTRTKIGIGLFSFGVFEFLFIVVFFAVHGIPAWVQSGFLLPPTEEGGYRTLAFVLFPFALEFSGVTMPDFVQDVRSCSLCYPLSDIIQILGMTSAYIDKMPQFTLWDMIWSFCLYVGMIILAYDYFNSKKKRSIGK